MLLGAGCVRRLYGAMLPHSPAADRSGAGQRAGTSESESLGRRRHWHGSGVRTCRRNSNRQFQSHGKLTSNSLS
jgi:hypothetical protein